MVNPFIIGGRGNINLNDTAKIFLKFSTSHINLIEIPKVAVKSLIMNCVYHGHCFVSL